MLILVGAEGPVVLRDAGLALQRLLTAQAHAAAGDRVWSLDRLAFMRISASGPLQILSHQA